jgi:hypothetical protein
LALAGFRCGIFQRRHPHLDVLDLDRFGCVTEDRFRRLNRSPKNSS